jgi:hypothetical protein
VADVVGFAPAIFNTPDGSQPSGFPARPTFPRPNNNAETMIYTPVNVVIDRAISGPWSPGPGEFLVEGGKVAVHYVVEGKSIDCFEMRVDDVPRVDPGSRYVFILSEALDNGGEKQLPLHKARFAWPVDSAGMVATPDGRMSIDQLTTVVVDATPSLGPQGS